MRTKDVDRITHNVGPIQTASKGAVWSGPALFAKPLSPKPASFTYAYSVFVLEENIADININYTSGKKKLCIGNKLYKIITS